MPSNNNQGRLLNDGQNKGIFSALESVRTPSGSIGNPELNYPEEVGTETMQNFLLITVYSDEFPKLSTSIKATNNRKIFDSIITSGLGGIAGSAASQSGNLFDLNSFTDVLRTGGGRGKSNESYVATTRVSANFERVPVESIALYIPGPISYTLSANYEGKETERRGWGEIGSNWLSGSVKGLGDFFTPGGKDNRLLSEGKAKNPNKEIAFKDIDERSFTFEYTFMPKTPKETDSVYNIIRTLRYFSHPVLPEGGGTSYTVPAEFEINLFTNGKENPWMPRLRRLVCESVDVTYGNDNHGLITFEDGAPAYIGMSLSFKEVEPLHRAHIEAGF